MVLHPVDPWGGIVKTTRRGDKAPSYDAGIASQVQPGGLHHDGREAIRAAAGHLLESAVRVGSSVTILLTYRMLPQASLPRMAIRCSPGSRSLMVKVTNSSL